MPRTTEKTVYTFDELPDSAKEKARDWWREGGLNYEWWDSTFADFESICEILGIEIDYQSGTSKCGKPTKGRPKIWFSGFWSQGDGACFEGSYSYKKGAVKAIKAHALQDLKLVQIAQELQDVQRRAFYSLEAKIRHSGHYYHAYCMDIDVSDSRTRWGDATGAQEAAIKEALRSLAIWLYRRLETEYEYLTSDEAVDESIIANECEFDENGNAAY